MGHGASTTKWQETPGCLFEKSESDLTSGSEVSMPWLTQRDENSPSDYFAQTRLLTVLSTDSEPHVHRDTGLEELFEAAESKKKKVAGGGRLLNRLARRHQQEGESQEQGAAPPDSPDSLGRVTPLPDNSDSGLDSDEEPTTSKLRGGYSLSQSPQIRRRQHQLGFIGAYEQEDYVL